MFPLKDNIPNERFPFVTVALVAINVIAYLLSIRHGGSFFGGPSDTTVLHNAAIPYDFTHPGHYCTLQSGIDQFGQVATEAECKRGPYPGQLPTWETALTAMFMHGGFLHIAGNMLFLAIFGPNVEDAMGYGRFIVFYLLGGLVALAAQVLVGPNSTAPTLGASGAIAAVLGGYIVLYPRRDPGRVPARLLVPGAALLRRRGAEQPGRRRRWRRLLRARRRVRVRPCADRALRRASQVRASPLPCLLMALLAAPLP